MIVISEFMDEAAVARLRNKFDTHYDPALADNQEKIPSLLENTRALIVRNRTKVTKEMLTAAPKLECVGRLGVGLDNIDQEACAARGVAVYPARGANDLGVAEYVITSAMILLRKAYLSGDRMLAGEWPRQDCSGREIFGKTLGLVGYGSIAQRTAGLAQAIGMKVIAYDPFLAADHPAWKSVFRMELTELMRASDVVSLHTPLTPQTRHLVDADLLLLMKADAILINAARGGVVDELALASALDKGKLGGAALDVFETEPLSQQAAKPFAGMRNVLLTPHIGGVDVEANQRESALIAEKVTQHLKSSGI